MPSNIIYPWRSHNSIHFLIDGKQFYPAMLKAIKHANHHILLEMYLFESGYISDKFIQAFITARQRHITVLLIVDAYGGKNLIKSDQDKLIQAGVSLVFYNPLLFYKLKKNLFRTHRKFLIIDGERLFVGGAGITDCFDGKKAWRETVIEVKGDVVKDWQNLFISNLKKCSDKPIPNLRQATHTNPYDVSARLAYTSGGTKLEIKKGLLNRIHHAQTSVWLASAYFIPSRKIRKALRKASLTGIDVRLLLPGPITDHPAIHYASRRYYTRLLRFGVRIFEYQGRFTHTKMVLIDDWFTIGSSNMDRWNFRWNLEANQEIKGASVAKEARTIMLNDFNYCQEITLQSWKKRSKVQRLKEWLWGKIDLWISKYLR